MSAATVISAKPFFMGFDPQAKFVEVFQEQDTVVKAAMVAGAVLTVYSILSSAFFGALAGAYVGTRLATVSPEAIIAQVKLAVSDKA